MGWAGWSATTGLLPELDAARWKTRGAAVPVETASLAGPLPLSGAAVDLWEYRAIAPRLPAFRTGTVELTARLPAHGQLRVYVGGSLAAAGPMPPIDAAPVAPPVHHPTWNPALPPPDAPQVDASPSVVFDRARDRIVGVGLTCAPAAGPPERATLRLDLGPQAVDVSVDGVRVTRCTGPWQAGEVVLAAGIERIHLERVSVQTPSGTVADNFGAGVRSPLAGLGVALVAAMLGVLLPLDLALLAAPALLLPVLTRLDLRPTLDALRLLAVPAPAAPLLFAGVPALLGLLAGLARRLRPVPALALACLPALAGAFVPTLGGAPVSPGLAAWGALAVPWTALAWVNLHPVRLRVGLSWLLSAALFGGAELAARHSALDTSWVVTAGWKRGGDEFRELLEIRRYRAYPDEGFPVRPPERDPTRRRIVALGGSSTGGAWQMDDLGLFWPARLGERVAGRGWEVVNQGVGGWNTLHVRLYVESQIERLEPDILALYVGHNDIRIPSPVRYRDLYAAYRATPSSTAAVATWLRQLRLYNGLTFAIVGLRTGAGGLSVPVADARENLSAILAAAQAHGARVLLMTEALNPDPLPMAPYGEMQRSLAAETGNLYLDAAGALWESGRPDLFLDDCHLSRAGHVLLAERIDAALTDAGWLAAP